MKRTLAALVLSALATAAWANNDPPPLADPAIDEASGLIDKGRYEEARLALGAALAEDPESADAWNLLGYLERRLQNYDRALENYGKALALDGSHTGALHYQGETYLELDRLADAEASLARLGLACSYACDDYNDLAEAVELYRKNRGA